MRGSRVINEELFKESYFVATAIWVLKSRSCKEV